MFLKSCQWCLVVFFVVSLPVNAQSVLGTWQGTQIDNGLPIVVDIEVTQLGLKDRSSSLSYASPRKCKVSLEYAGEVDKEHIFYVYDLTGKTWCYYTVKPSGGKYSIVKMKLSDNGGLIYEIFKDGSRIEGGALKRL